MKKWQIILGIVLIISGLFSLLDTLFVIDLDRFIFPIILIGIGLLMILRLQLAAPGVEVLSRIFGDIRKSGP